MQKIAEFICKQKKAIVFISLILLVLSFIGMELTKVNYDILVYLPEDIETIKGQNILTDDFNMGSYSIAVAEDLSSHEILELEEKIKKVDGVNEVASLYDVFGTTIPIDILPDEILDKVHAENTDILFITFAGSTSSKQTLDAVSEIRKITDSKISQGGMSSMVVDTKNLSEQEIFIYIVIAVILCIIVLQLSLDSYIVPFILLINIGVAILFNLGSNIFLGQISYITKALVAVLQLGVTTDFSIFLYHSYEKKKGKENNEKAMVEAIKETFTSVTGSSLTTIAGFLVLCTMQLTLGRDLGIVMAKGVFLGVVCVLTLFPSLLLMFDKQIEKTKHKNFVPNFTKLNSFVIKHKIIIFAIFLICLVPMYLAYTKVDVYYKLDKSLPDTLESIKTNKFLKDKYNIVSPEIILVDKDLKIDDMNNLGKDLENIDGIEWTISLAKFQKLGLNDTLLDKQILNLVKNDKYQAILVNSIYETATDELNSQVDEVNKVVKKYDENAIVAGEGPLMKDLVSICDVDFKNVNISSIVCIFIILFFVLKSVSLPFLLISAIEFAIFTNMSISYFGGVTLPFIAPIVLGTIQLGATIDYAILLTTTYLEKRRKKINKEKAMLETLNYCGTSVFISGMCFFAATFGVGVYSQIEMIGALCTLISRGAIISMLTVITILPSILLIFDKVIMVTTLKGRDKMKKFAVTAILIGLVLPNNISALEKNETVYGKLGYDGVPKNILVSEQIINRDNSSKIEDYTELENILNINDNRTFKKTNNKLIWDAEGKDVFYQGTTKKELPVTVNVSYKLNDKEMKLDKMIGKKGKVTITLKYTNKDLHYVNGEALYTPFIVTMGTIINNENNRNIQVSNGKVISNGTKSIIVGLSTPGLYESLGLNELVNMDTITISYETDKFELASIYNVITPKLISNADLSIFNKVDTIYSQVDLLGNSMNKLDEGAKQLASGSNLIKTKLGESLNSLANSNALSEEQILGIKNLTVNGVEAEFTNEKKATIANTAWTGVKEVLDQKVANHEVDENIEAYVTESVTAILGAYLGGAINPETGLPVNLMYYSGCINDQNPQQAQACAALTAANFDKDQVTAFKNQIINSVSTAATKTTYHIAEDTAKQVAVDTSLETAKTTANNVAKQLAPQVANQVMQASKESLTTLYNGIDELDNGINTLSSGISKFNSEGISKITDITNNKLRGTTNRIKQLIYLGNEYNSFASDSLLENSETKFILIINSKNVNESENKKEVKEEKKDNVIDRFTNLFN